jgi:Fe-S oxidoreductase
MKVTYHDPCHLGRHEGVYNAPRECLEAIPGIEVVEMPRSKEYAWCCGGGSIVSNVYPDLTSDIATDRVEEAQKTGAEMIISACPSCEGHLQASGRKTKLKVDDINIVFAKAIGLDI